MKKLENVKRRYDHWTKNLSTAPLPPDDCVWTINSLSKAVEALECIVDNRCANPRLCAMQVLEEIKKG